MSHCLDLYAVLYSSTKQLLFNVVSSELLLFLVLFLIFNIFFGSVRQIKLASRQLFGRIAYRISHRIVYRHSLPRSWDVVTFRVSRIDHAKCTLVTCVSVCVCVCVCVCLAVGRRMPTLLHGPGCNLGEL